MNHARQTLLHENDFQKNFWSDDDDIKTPRVRIRGFGTLMYNLRKGTSKKPYNGLLQKLIALID